MADAFVELYVPPQFVQTCNNVVLGFSAVNLSIMRVVFQENFSRCTFDYNHWAIYYVEAQLLADSLVSMVFTKDFFFLVNST